MHDHFLGARSLTHPVGAPEYPIRNPLASTQTFINEYRFGANFKLSWRHGSEIAHFWDSLHSWVISVPASLNRFLYQAELFVMGRIGGNTDGLRGATEVLQQSTSLLSATARQMEASDWEFQFISIRRRALARRTWGPLESFVKRFCASVVRLLDRRVNWLEKRYCHRRRTASVRTLVSRWL